MIVFCISMHIHCMSNHLLVCLPIILSVCLSFCPSVYPYVCSHIVKIAKSIAKSSKIDLKSIVQLYENKSSMKWKKYWKENCIEKPHRCSYELVLLLSSFHTLSAWYILPRNLHFQLPEKSKILIKKKGLALMQNTVSWWFSPVPAIA